MPLRASSRCVACLSGAVLLALAGCGSRAPHIVRVTGEVGPLRMDRSDAAAIIAFAGKPDATTLGSAYGGPQYRALGYGCGSKRRGSLISLVRGGPSCRTVFFVDRRTGRLETFYTASADYSDQHGVRVGMSQAEAERRLHRRLTIGCTTALYFDSPTASLSISFAGGVAQGTSIRGAHVDALVLHGKLRDAGVFDCL